MQAAAGPPPSRADVEAMTEGLAQAAAASARGEYAAALELYSQAADAHPGLALAHRARLQRALLLWEAGLGERSLLELQSEAAEVGAGNAQIHAALAVVLHSLRPAQVGRAESEWAVAVELAPRYADPAWVESEQRWPPKLLAALQRFLALS